MKIRRFIFSVIILIICENSFTEQKIVVLYSDGRRIGGLCTNIRSKKVRIYTTERKVEVIEAEKIKRIEFKVAKRKKEKKWVFMEAGQVRKQTFGKTYPVIYLTAKVVLVNRKIIEGHLYTTNFKVETSDNDINVVLKYKIKGKEGENFDKPVYPVKIEFLSNNEGNNQKESATNGQLLRLPKGNNLSPLYPALEYLRKNVRNVKIKKIVLIKKPALIREEIASANVSSLNEKYDFIGIEAKYPNGDEQNINIKAQGSIEIKKKNVIYIYWPWKLKENYIESISGKVKDFFDKREILAGLLDKKNLQIYTLMRLRRIKKTSLKKKKRFPWRIEVWRWKIINPSSGIKVMLAAKNYFFRGIVSENEKIPEIILIK